MDAKQTEELNKITATLNSEFDKGGRRLIFWYDEGGKFEEMVLSEEFATSLHAKMIRMEKTETFQTKYKLEYEDKGTSYLVYAPFTRPADEDNHLCDTIAYSKVFSADALSMFLNSMKVPEHLKSVFAKYKNVFDSANNHNNVANKKRFLALQMENFTAQDIELGILATLAKARSYSFDEIIKTLLLDDLENNKGIGEFEKYNVLTLFWDYVERYFGFRADTKDLSRLITSLIVTYANQHIAEGKGLKGNYTQFLCDKTNNCEVFIANFMKSFGCDKRYDELAEMVAKRIDIAKTMDKMPTEEIEKCDAFECIDKILISRSVQEVFDHYDSIEALPLADDRLKRHFGKKYFNEYKCLSYAVQFLKSEREYTSPSSCIQAIKNYVEVFEKIDRNYRKFCFYCDKTEENSSFDNLKQTIENIYTNNYLKKSSVDFAPFVKEALKLSITLKQQRDFYEKNIAKRKDKVIVIISDAFRFEVAKELSEELKRKNYDEVNLEYALASLPTYTQLGMSALLPHREIAMNSANNYKITVDGMPSDSVAARGKILCGNDSNSFAVSFNDVIVMKPSELKATFNGKSVVYIYHDTIDGASHSNENKVFSACETAIKEIYNLIQKLSGYRFSANYVITADHGFIYKKDKISESDKVSLGSLGNASVNKRYILSQGAIEESGTQCIPMNYILSDAATCVTVPIGADIFKCPGGGQNFVHGGASLQELVIPVLSVHTQKDVAELEKTKISVLDLTRKVSNLITNIEFVQTKPVSESVQPATYRLYFESATGEVVSNEEILVADRKEENADARVYKKRFTFRDMNYKLSHKYYLVIKDEKTGDEVDRMEYSIDIAFAGGFGF